MTCQNCRHNRNGLCAATNLSTRSAYLLPVFKGGCGTGFKKNLKGKIHGVREIIDDWPEVIE